MHACMLGVGCYREDTPVVLGSIVPGMAGVAAIYLRIITDPEPQTESTQPPANIRVAIDTLASPLLVSDTDSSLSTQTPSAVSVTT